MVEDGDDIMKNIDDIEFFGYDSFFVRVVVKSFLVGGKFVVRVIEGSEVEILFDRILFYVELGG